MRWALLMMSTVTALARADLQAPSPSPAATGPCADLLAFDCYPLVSSNGVVAVPRPRLGPTDDFTLHEVELITSGQPFLEREVLSGDAIVARLRRGGFRKLPPPILTGAYGVGSRRFRLQAQAEGWTFRVEGGAVIAARDGKTRWRRTLHPGGLECYEHTPWVMTLWLEPQLGLLVIAAWGDKCMMGAPSWEVVSLQTHSN
jgi:hypothetical protein